MLPRTSKQPPAFGLQSLDALPGWGIGLERIRADEELFRCNEYLGGSLHMDFANAPSDDELHVLRGKVARYPTDPQLRFASGAALFALRDYDAAISELHEGLGNPQVRIPALKLLIEAYDANGMPDRAALLRQTLSREFGDDSDSGSAPVPAPTRPISPLDSSRGKKRPNEDDRAS